MNQTFPKYEKTQTLKFGDLLIQFNKFEDAIEAFYDVEKITNTFGDDATSVRWHENGTLLLLATFQRYKKSNQCVPKRRANTLIKLQ